MSTIDRTIATLRPGRSARIGGGAAVWTTVERTGDGAAVRFVRHTPTGFRVFNTSRCS